MSILFSSQLLRRFKCYFIFHYNLISSLGSEFEVVELSESPESPDELLGALSCARREQGGREVPSSRAGGP